MTDSNPHANDDATGLYVHIPFCTRKCAYCAFYSEPVDKHNTARLIQALIKELAQVNTQSVQTIYIGGGSPSCLPLNELTSLIQAITQTCPTIREFTVECNPSQATSALLACLHDLGVNRLSLGVQSFNAQELAILGRSHAPDTIARVVQAARNAGFTNLSLDLIFAICGSTLKTWQASLNQAIALAPDHISVYALTLEPGTPLAQAVTQGQLTAIDDATDHAMYEQAIHTLAQAGFEQYEISNFAKPGFECRHNLGTWQNEPYIGIGPSASSYNGVCRTDKIGDIQAYIEAVESNRSPVQNTFSITPEEQICETAVLNLRTRHGIDIKRFKQITGQDPRIVFAGPIQTHCEQGLLTVEQDRIFLTAKALPIADSVLCDFASL